MTNKFNITTMKNLTFIVLILFFMSCERDQINLNNPNVDRFVQQIKTGTYDQYEKGEDGENLWLLMPRFTEKDIASLIDHASDTSQITAYPFNPMSSRTPFPGRNHGILGECLLWTVEGVRNGSGYGSLDPFLIDTSLDESERYKGLTGADILIIRDIYDNWWMNHKADDWKTINPLENTPYIWF